MFAPSSKDDDFSKSNNKNIYQAPKRKLKCY